MVYLLIGESQPVLQVGIVFVVHVDLEGNDTPHVFVHVSVASNMRHRGSEVRVILANQTVEQTLSFGEPCDLK